MKIIKLNSRPNQGFTIVELMIALSVLSTILIMSTVILIQIGSIYSKGVNEANLQNAARTIVADLSSSLQFSGNVPSPCTQTAINCYAPSVTSYPTDPNTVGSGLGQFQAYAFCIGTTRYSYALNRELGTDQGVNPAVTTTHVLWRDTMTSPNDPCYPLDLSVANPSSGVSTSTGGYEMAGSHMRLTRFNIYETSTTSDVYNVDVWMAYGDSDLVNTQSLTDPTPGSSTCNGGVGTAYCAASAISTSLTGRIY